MNLSKKLLLVVGFVGLCAGRPVAALSNETKGALEKAALSTLVFGAILYPCCNMLVKGIDKILPGLGTLVKPILSGLFVIADFQNDKVYAKELSLLPDVDDKKLIASCKKIFIESGAKNADKLQIKLDENFSPGVPNGYAYPSVYMVIPTIVVNAAALKYAKRSTVLHELGHLVDVKNCTIKSIGEFLIVPLGVIWVVQPAAQKVTEYVCEPLLEKIVDSTGAVTEQVTGSKKIAESVKTSLSTAKELVKIGGTLGLVFVSCVGMEALFAAFSRKNEKFADNFACSNLKNAPVSLITFPIFAKSYTDYEKDEQSKHPVLSWINSWFASHPSGESRVEKFLVHAGAGMLKQSLKGSTEYGLENVVTRRLDKIIAEVNGK